MKDGLKQQKEISNEYEKTNEAVLAKEACGEKMSVKAILESWWQYWVQYFANIRTSGVTEFALWLTFYFTKLISYLFL